MTSTVVLLGLSLFLCGCSDSGNTSKYTYLFQPGTSAGSGGSGGGGGASSSGMGFSRYNISYDSNSNGVVNSGETVDLRVYLNNISGSTVSRVRANLTTDSPYVNITDSDAIYYNGLGYDYVGAGAESHYGYRSFSSYMYYYNDCTYIFQTYSSTPIGHVINFTVHITSDSGYSTGSFAITVH